MTTQVDVTSARKRARAALELAACAYREWQKLDAHTRGHEDMSDAATFVDWVADEYGVDLR